MGFAIPAYFTIRNFIPKKQIIQRMHVCGFQIHYSHCFGLQIHVSIFYQNFAPTELDFLYDSK